ncbi:MAG: hypothetical protein J1E65_06780 [Lachnospiraceae bacterium]|nr:hypothetical protein [Lachnospiraceae bacterium]
MQDYSYITMSAEQLVPGVDNQLFRRYLEMVDRGGEKLQKEIQMRAEKLMSRPKPGKLCFGTCWIDDERCAGCTAAQEKVYNGIIEIRQLEQVLMNPELLNSKKFDKCDLCGAPYEPGEIECTYCGKAYPEGSVSIDLPKSIDELRRMIRRKAYEAWQGYPAVIEQQVNWLKKDADEAGDVIMQFTFGAMSTVVRPSYTMSLEQLERGADLNAMSLSEYMMAVILGKVEAESAKALKEQQEAAHAQKMERNRQQHELNMAAIQQQSRSQQEFWERRRASYRPPQYNGGSGVSGSRGYSHTCVDCTYYSAAAGRCAYKGTTTNAGDSCVFYKLK